MVVSILLYGCTTWTLTKWQEKKLDSNYTRILRAILNKSWRQHPTRHQLYGHLPPITKTIQVRRTRHAGPPHMAKQKQDDQLEPTYSSYVKTQDVTLKTCRRRWMIGRSGERWSGISCWRHDMMMNDDDIERYFPYKTIFKMTDSEIERLRFILPSTKLNVLWWLPGNFLFFPYKYIQKTETLLNPNRYIVAQISKYIFI